VCDANIPHHVAGYRWGYRLLRCAHCGLLVTELPANFDTASIYTAEYFEGGGEAGKCAYESYRASKPILLKEFSRTVQRIRRFKPTGRLLEIGCAYGFFLEAASRYYQAVGIEVSEHAARIAQDSGFDVRITCLEDAGFADHSFDIAVMLDTIEHLPRPRRTLKEVFHILAPSGAVLITTGDVSSLHARIMGSRWRLLTPPQHVFFFSRYTLCKLLRGLGFNRCVVERPWKYVPVDLICYHARKLYGVKLPCERTHHNFGIWINLFDTVRVIARKL